jgi:hypothetical protein
VPTSGLLGGSLNQTERENVELGVCSKLNKCVIISKENTLKLNTSAIQKCVYSTN